MDKILAAILILVLSFLLQYGYQVYKTFNSNEILFDMTDTQESAVQEPHEIYIQD